MKKIALLAEDEAVTRKLLSVVLEQLGYDVIACENGQLCVDTLESGLKPDVLVLDLHMPVLSGMQVLERLVALQLVESFPIMISTGNKDQETVLKALTLGAHDYIVKPIDLTLLKARISDLVFQIEEPELRSLIGNLRMHDTSLLRMPGLQRWAQREVDAYAATHGAKSICVLLPAGVGPQIVAKVPLAELTAKVGIFRKCAYGWRKVWPTYAVTRRASRASA